jgi:serine protease Do
MSALHYLVGSRRVRMATLAAGIALCFAGAPLALAQAPQALDRSTAGAASAVELPSFAPMVKRVLPAVVNVQVEMHAPANEQMSLNEFGQGGPGGGDEGQPLFPPSPFDQFLRRFFQQNPGGMAPPQRGEALGSGFIIDPLGYVVTNNHVVENADKVTVVFQDGSKHPAKIVGRDPKTDLALLKINADHPLPYVEWGDSNATQVGDWVLAVGNPFGLGGTVSSGIISARGRDIHSGPYDDFLQIDASINRGNSGGPTFNLDGKVIGINTAIYSPNGGSVGIGFAIPSSLAKPVIDQIRAHGKVERGWLGVQIQEVTPEIAKTLGLPKAEGALVADVTAGGPAEKIGIKQGDVIVGYDGHAIEKLRDLPLAVAETPVGQKAEVKVWRDGHEQTLEPMIAEMPEHPEQVARGEEAAPESHPQTASTMGLKLEPLTADLRRELHVPRNVKGVVVSSVAPSSPLADLGLAPGDVIQAINQEPVATPKEVIAKLDAAKKGSNKSLLFLINRHGINEFVALSVGNGGNG